MSKTTRRVNTITSTIIVIAIRVVVIAVVIAVMGTGIKKAYAFGHSIFYAEAMEEEPGHDVVVSIPDGTDAKGVAKILINKGLVDNKYSIIVQSKFFEYQVVPGTYTLNTSMTSRDILKKINEGPSEEKETEAN